MDSTGTTKDADASHGPSMNVYIPPFGSASCSSW